MSYLVLAYCHLATVTPAFLMGTYLLYEKKGSAMHKRLGKVYMLLMLITASITLLMPAQVGESVFDHFGWIHLLSMLVFYSVLSAYIAIKNGNVKKHKAHMKGLYFGGLLVAGTFTFMPGRLLHTWFIA